MRTGGNLPDGTPFKPSGLLGQYAVPRATNQNPLTLAEKARLAAMKAEEETAARNHAQRTPAQKRAYTLNNKRIEASLAAQEKLYKDEQAAKRQDEVIARIKNPPPRSALLVTPPRIEPEDKLTDAKMKRAREAALRKNPPPDPNAPKPTKQPPTPKPVERPAPKPNYALPRTKNDITGNRNNALRAAGEASRANPGESRHHEYLLNHEGVRVSRVKPSTPVVPTPTIPTPTIPTNFERPAPKLKPYTPTSVLTGIPKPPPKPAWGYALGRPMGQLALFPRGNNEGVVPSGTGVHVSPQLKPTKVSANQLQLELPNPSPRKDPPLQYTPPKPPPNTGKGRLVPTPKSDIKISGPTTYSRIPRGTRGAIRGAKGFGGGALGVLAVPLIYGTAFAIKERSFSGFLKGLDVWAGGGTPYRAPDA